VRTVTATRYVTPLREGGSLPAIVEADDQGLYVAKFRGAGQGAKALVAEVIAGELLRAAGLRVPDLALLEVGRELGRNEPDPEIRALLLASVGLNLGVDYLPGSLAFDPVASQAPDAAEASAVLLLDALLGNVDRTPRNTNLLTWHRRLWLIDHGASLTFHHDWAAPRDAGRTPPAALAGHVLLPWATRLPEVAGPVLSRLDRAALEGAVAAVPEAWLAGEPAFASVAEHRAAYLDHLARRLEAAAAVIEEAERARAALV
jgi:hypothetical protein